MSTVETQHDAQTSKSMMQALVERKITLDDYRQWHEQRFREWAQRMLEKIESARR
jgi:hypothetical protein